MFTPSPSGAAVSERGNVLRFFALSVPGERLNPHSTMSWVGECEICHYCAGWVAFVFSLQADCHFKKPPALVLASHLPVLKTMPGICCFMVRVNLWLRLWHTSMTQSSLSPCAFPPLLTFYVGTSLLIGLLEYPEAKDKGWLYLVMQKCTTVASEACLPLLPSNPIQGLFHPGKAWSGFSYSLCKCFMSWLFRQKLYGLEAYWVTIQSGKADSNLSPPPSPCV